MLSLCASPYENTYYVILHMSIYLSPIKLWLKVTSFWLSLTTVCLVHNRSSINVMQVKWRDWIEAELGRILPLYLSMSTVLWYCSPLPKYLLKLITPTWISSTRNFHRIFTKFWHSGYSYNCALWWHGYEECRHCGRLPVFKLSFLLACCEVLGFFPALVSTLIKWR